MVVHPLYHSRMRPALLGDGDPNARCLPAHLLVSAAHATGTLRRCVALATVARYQNDGLASATHRRLGRSLFCW